MWYLAFCRYIVFGRPPMWQLAVYYMEFPLHCMTCSRKTDCWVIEHVVSLTELVMLTYSPFSRIHVSVAYSILSRISQIPASVDLTTEVFVQCHDLSNLTPSLLFRVSTPRSSRLALCDNITIILFAYLTEIDT